MSEQEVWAFLAQFDQARAEFKTWPTWMQHSARTASATFPRTSPLPSDGEMRNELEE